MAFTGDLGRVQGAGSFYTIEASGTSVARSSIQPQELTPFVGDRVSFSNGDVRRITGVSGSTVTLGEVMWSNKGDPGIGDAHLLNGDGDSIVDGATQAAVKGVLQAKNYYNLGAFDTYVSNGDGTGTVTNQTGIVKLNGSEVWSYVPVSRTVYTDVYNKEIVDTGDYDDELGTYDCKANTYFGGRIFLLRISSYGRVNISISNISSADEFVALLKKSPITIVYKKSNPINTYNVIENFPIRPANQEECVYWHEEWWKGLNLARPNGNITTRGVTFTVAPNGIIANGTSTEATSGSSVYYLRVPVSELKGKTISLSGRTNDDLAIEGYWVDSNDSMHYFNGKGVVDGTPAFIPTNAKDVKVYLAVRGGTTANNVLFRPMLVASNHPYPYEPYNGDIIHENRVPLYITTESLSPAQTIGGDWESLGSFTTNTNQTLYAWRKI